jgi:hypothetical protein
MKTWNFYHQKRKDGGIRTGVELNGERVLEGFKPGRRSRDSALEWFVDARCRGRHLPDTPETIRHWLLEKSAGIQGHLERMASELRAGMDTDWPLTSVIPKGSNGVEIKIVCSAVRRLSWDLVAADRDFERRVRPRD